MLIYTLRSDTLPLCDPHRVRRLSAKLLRSPPVSVFCLWNNYPSKSSYFPVPRGLCRNAVSVLVGPVWLRFLLSLCYLGGRMTAFCALIQPSYSSLHHSCSASPWLCYTMSSCGAVWSETSAPLLLQNPLITWFCLCVVFFKSRQYEKKSQKHTNCPHDSRGNTITGNTFTTNPALSPQWLVLHAKQDGRMSPVCAPSYQQLQHSLGSFTASPAPVSLIASGFSAVTQLRSTSTFVIFSAEVEVKSCVRQQDC